VKVQAVISLKADHPLGVLLDIAGFARSTFFYHQAKLAGPDPHADLKAAVREVFEEAKGRYGHRRVHTELAKVGWTLAKKTVLKVMRSLGLICQVRRRRRYNSFKGKVGRIAANLLNRDFTAQAPNEKWVTDVTEFAVGDRKVYLSPVMDLFDRSIIAYSWGTSPNLQLTTTPLEKALSTLQVGQTPLVHSDQGFQYQHLSWQAMLADAGAVQSMSRKGTCLDNAVIESFFGHLKEELFHHVTYLSIDAFTTALDEYMHWYNTERISTKLNGLSPAQYRAQTVTA
jgi:putative transposase